MTLANHYRYTGEQWDNDLGMYYLRARYLNPNTGRFWTMDSYEGDSQDPRSLHKYLYCHANPANMVDFSGNAGDFLSFQISMSTVAIMSAGGIAGVGYAYYSIKWRMDWLNWKGFHYRVKYADEKGVITRDSGFTSDREKMFKVMTESQARRR